MTKIRSPIIVVVGHSDHGKCVSPNSLIPLTDGRIITAEALFDEYARVGATNIDRGIVVESDLQNSPEIFSLGKDGKIVGKKITHLWKLRSNGKLVKIKLKSGDEISVTPEHPFFVVTSDLKVVQRKASDISLDDFVIVPRNLHLSSDLDRVKTNIILSLGNTGNFLVRLNLEKSSFFFKKIRSSNVQSLKKMGLFSGKEIYSYISKNRFRAKDFVKLTRFFGFDDLDSYEMIHEIKNSSEKWRSGHTSNWMRVPHSEEDFRKLGYIFGCLAGDGYIPDGKLNKNDKDIQENYRRAVKDALNLDSKVMSGHTCEYVITNGGTTFERFLIDVCNFPKMDKAATIQLPLGFQSYLPLVAGFIEGWLDTDGYVSFFNNSIEITSKSKSIVKQVGIWLLAYGINSTICEKNGYNILRIANKPFLQSFLQNLRPRSERKFKRIQEAASKASTSRIFDITPLSGTKLVEFDIKAPRFSWYKNRKNLSRRYIEEILEKSIDNSNELIQDMKSLVESEVSTVRVIKKEEVPYDGFVYDFTVPDTHNFVAERIIIHNTTLLDKIRGTTVTKSEHGALTQHTGASFVPLDVIQNISGKLIEKFKIKVEVPGLLFIDTPGHKAFLGMRRRGGSVSDLAILVVDVTEGFQEQTDESLKILKEYKTPFIVAATKLDRIRGWFPNKNSSFLDSFSKQRDDVKDEVESSIYKIVSQLSERGFDSERFDRINNFAKQIAVVPVSSTTGEGIPDLLMMLAGLAQQFLKGKLEISDKAKGSIIEVKEVRGMGLTMDVIVYDGTVRKNDYIIIGGKEPKVTRVKALLKPRRLQELRTEKQFETIDEISAAAGIKISALDLEGVIAGSPVVFVSKESEVEKAKKEIQKEVEMVEFSKNIDGVILKADTLGSLEAMIKIMGEEKIPIKKAEAGAASKQDIVEAQNVKDPLKRVILCFNVEATDDMETLAKDLDVKIFSNEIIYRLVEEYKEWVDAEKNKEMKQKEMEVTRPCEIRIIGPIFRQSKPAVFGIEVLRGVLKPGVMLAKGKKKIDYVKGIEKEGKSVSEVKKGDKIAISMEKVTFDRYLKEGDVLKSVIPESDMKILREIFDKLSEDEKELLQSS